MRKFGFTAGTSCVVLALALAARADDDKGSRDIVAKAIKAHGGEKNLKKAWATHVKANGTLDSMNGLKFSAETFLQYPDKFKNVIELAINNMNVTVTQVYNGKNFWINAAGNKVELKDAKDLAEMKETMYLEKLGDLVSLNDKGIELSPVGEVKVNDKDAVGIRASSKGHRDLNLYFDKKTGLLVKTEARVFDIESKQEVSQEKIFSDYKEIGGLMTAHRLVINKDGKRHASLTVSEVAYVDRHDDSIFAEP